MMLRYGIILKVLMNNVDIISSAFTFKRKKGEHFRDARLRRYWEVHNNNNILARFVYCMVTLVLENVHLIFMGRGSN